MSVSRPRLGAGRRRRTAYTPRRMRRSVRRSRRGRRRPRAPGSDRERSRSHSRPDAFVGVGRRRGDAGRDGGDRGRTAVGRPRKRERSAQRSSRSTSPAPSAGHRPRRAGRVKGGAVRGPRTPHSTVATRCPPGTLDPTTTTSRAASTRKPGRSRVRATHTTFEDRLRSLSRSLSMKTGAGARGRIRCFPGRVVGGWHVAAGDERVQVERPQPRSGEDDDLDARGTGGTMEAPGNRGGGSGPGVVAGLGVWEPRSSLYRRLEGRTRWDGRGFAPVAHLSSGALYGARD